MKHVDISGLVKGLMVIIGIALAMGKLEELKRWAAREAFLSHASRKVQLGLKR